jgi:hypothetical protein
MHTIVLMNWQTNQLLRQDLADKVH